MKNFLRGLLLVILLVFTTGCASLGNSVVRTRTGITGGHFLVSQYSGGQLIRQWEVRGIITEEEYSDGWNFNCHGLVRLSGDVVVEPFKSAPEAIVQDERVICN